MIKKRYLFLIMLVCLFAISAVSAAENITDNIVGIEETADNFVNVEYSEINDCDVNNNDYSKVLGLNDSNNDEEILYSINDDGLISSGTYPSYSDYSVSVYDTSINYEVGGSISMSISPSSSSTYKYDYYLWICDSSNKLKISQQYYSSSSSYSEYYDVGAYDLSPGTYTIEIVNYYDNGLMDTAKLTVKSSSSYSTYPSYSDYSVRVPDTTINYDSRGSIYMDISSSSSSSYKYDYYLRVYDSSNIVKISKEYYGTSRSYSESYSVGAYELSPGTYTIEIVNFYDDVVMDTATLTVKSSSSYSTYPSYSDYSVSVSDTIIYYGSGGSISMSISPASGYSYKYDYCLWVYDSSDDLKISQQYYSSSISYSESYSVGAYELSPGTYTMYIVNYYDYALMDEANLTVKSSSSSSTYPSFSDYSVTVSDTIIYYGSGGSISMSISPASGSSYKYDYYLKVYDYSGNLKISQEYYSQSSSNSKSYSVGAYDLSPGTYTVKIVNYADNVVMDTATLTVKSSSGSSSTYPSYSDYSVTVSDKTITYGSGGSIPMSISPASSSSHKYDYYLKVYDSSDNLKISERYYSSSSSSSMSYSVGAYDLSPGSYTVKIVNYYDDNVMDTAKLTVKDTSNKLSAPSVTKYYGGSERFVVSLKDNAGNPLSGQSVTITLNGVEYPKTTDSNGQASMAINLNSGKYNLTTEYDGEKVYSTVTVKDSVISKDFSKIYKNGTQYYGTFVDSQGNRLKNTDVSFNINGVFYTKTTDSNGVARMNINLNPGTYILTAKNPVTGEQHTTKITVLPSIVENKNIVMNYKDGTKYRVKILGNDGKAVGSGVKVKFNINGVFYERTTDSSGYAGLNINLIPGTYTITAEYNGLKASNTIKIVSVLQTNNLNMKFRDGSKFEAKIVDNQGNPRAGQTVTFNINGVFYHKTTDSSGIARLSINLKAGNYIITTSYNGLNAANTVSVAPDYLYYTIGSNPLDYNYYMNEYNRFSFDWHYSPQWDAMVRTIYDVYGNQGMEIQDQYVKYGIKYFCYEASTGKEIYLNRAGEVIQWSYGRGYSEVYIKYDQNNNIIDRGKWVYN